MLKNPEADWEDDRHLVHHVGAWARGQAAQSKHARVSIQNKRYTLVNNEELYDLQTDPGETKNIIAEHPKVVNKLRKIYDRWWTKVQPRLVNEDAKQQPADDPYFSWKSLFDGKTFEGWEQLVGNPKLKIGNDKNKLIVLDNLSTGRKENIKNFKNLNFVNCDISKKGKWVNNFKNIDCVFHVAALADIVPSINNPTKYYKSNVDGTLNVLEACKKYSVKKLIYTASSSCYGIPKKYPTKETEVIDNQYPYALTKYLGEQLCLHWGKLFNIDVISLRLFNVYGTRSRTSGTYGAMFGVFLAQKLAKKPFTIVGSGEQTRDFTYVTDVVSALIKASKSKIKNQIFNVGSGKTISINKIVKLLGGSRVKIPKRPGEPDCTFANINKIKKLIKWKPKIQIEEGIKLLIKDINYWKKAPVWTPKKIDNATKDWFRYLGKKNEK